MQIKHIVLAVAAAVVAPSAMAGVDLTTLGVPAANIFYISGASAQTPGLAKTLTAFCNAGSITTYTDPAGTNDFVYHCSSAKASVGAAPNVVSTGFTAGAQFIVVKMDQGGSANGVGPVSPNATAATMAALPKFASLVCTGPAASANAAAIAGSNGGSCALETTAIKPQLGLSDVSKAIWLQRGQITAAESAGLTQVSGFAGQGFGVLVSSELYALLQADQGTTGRPNLSANQYASLAKAGVDGGVWNILLPNSAKAAAAGNALPTGVTSFPPVSSLGTSTLTLTRRGPTSGTQAASDIYFLNNPCENGGALQGGLAPTPGSATPYTDTLNYLGSVDFVVTEGGSTGAVKNAVGAAGFGIGVVSLENPEGGLPGGAKYLSINGIDPIVDTLQKANVVNGKYDFAFESELLKPIPVAANVNTFATALVKDLSNGNNLTGITGIYTDGFSAIQVEGQTNHYSRSNNACKKESFAW
jgi:hypothetical protein